MWRLAPVPRFFLNLFNDEDVPDEEGTDLPDLAAATTLAIGAARALIAEHVTEGRAINLVTGWK